ncbi:MAG: rod shape-determining protein RodA [Acidimicrobiales bacterium]|nr:rod shape-determining protein RodA [Acidimicrobiales bacterium]
MAVATPRRRELNPKGDPLSPWWHLDVLLVLAAGVLTVVGLAMIYSATRGLDPENYDRSLVERQFMFAVVGAALMVGAVLIPYARLKAWAPVLYIGGIVGCLAVLSPLGVEVNGAQAWLQIGPMQLQPSEFVKVAFIVVFAGYLSRFDGELDLQRLAGGLLVAAIPLGVILLQPDVGTGLVFVAITLAMLVIGGIRGRHLLVLVVVGVIGVAVIINSPLLQEYQRDRLTSFLDPGDDAGGAAYQQRQAQIAIGAGGLTGAGYGEGSQTRGDFIPEQQTDFIFTVVGEELGFVGAGGVLALFAIIVWRTWRAARVAADPFGTLLCTGVMAMIVFQVFEAVGMTMGIMPITGIPLPLVSYGGSSILATLTALGLVINVSMRRWQ